MTREELKARILDYLKVEGGSQYENLRQFGLERSIYRRLTHRETEWESQGRGRDEQGMFTPGFSEELGRPETST